MMWTGLIMLGLGLILFFGSLGGKSDKRFKTGQKDNDVGDSTMVGIGFLGMIGGGVILWIATSYLAP